MVKRVLALLNIDVRSLIRAASMTEIITPRSPEERNVQVTGLREGNVQVTGLGEGNVQVTGLRGIYRSRA